MKNRAVSLIKFFLGWPLSLLAVFFLGKFVLSQTAHFSWNSFHPNGWIVTLSIISFCVYFLLRSVFWQQLLKIQNHTLSLKETAYLWGISELQRYIPGNIWSILGRTMSFEKRGVAKSTTTKSWAYEAEFLCASSLIVSLLATNFIIYGLLPDFSYKWVFPTIITIAAWVVTIVFIGNKNLLSRVLILRHIFPGYSFGDNVKLLFIMTGAMCFFGLGTYLSLVSFTPLYPYDFTSFIGFFAFSFAIGYIAIIFPMGLGPREALMTYGLSKYIPLSLAGLGAFFSRILLIIGELLFLIVTFAWYKTPDAALEKVTLFVKKHKYLLATSVLVLIYILYFTTITILRYNNFFTGRFDLGNMDQTVWNTVHGRIFQLTDPDGTNIISRLSVHADFILILLAPFYYLWQDPRMLLVIQTVVLASGAFFVYFLGSDSTKNKLAGFIFAAIFLFNPALEYTNLYDFHGVTLATTFFLGSYYFLKKRQTLLFLLFLILAGSTKEEAWVVVALMGLYAFFIEKKKVLGTTIFLLGSALFYFIFFKAIPFVRGGQHFAIGFYSDFGNSPSSILKTMIFSPQKTLATIFQPSKLRYLHELLFPLGYLSLFAPMMLIFALPDLAVNLLSSNTAFHEIYYQYTAVINAFLFITAIYGFVRAQRLFPKATTPLLILLMTSGILSAYFYGPLPISRKENVDMFWLQQQNKTVINDFLSSIPRRYSIAATNNIGSHLSHRQLIYTIPKGIDRADILVFLLNDKYAQPSLPAQIKMTENLRNDSRYVQALHVGDFVVFEKKSIYPHMKASNRPNSLFPSLIQGFKQSFSGSTSSSRSS